MLVIVNGVRIQRANNGDMYFAGTPGLPPPFDEPPDVPAHYALEFAGGIICIIFWVGDYCDSGMWSEKKILAKFDRYARMAIFVSHTFSN